MLSPKRLLIVAGATVLAAALTSCGGGGSSDSKPAPQPQQQAQPAATTSAAPQTRETELIKTAKPFADKLAVALKANDLPGARAAYEAYDAAWNGIEVYTNFRDRKLYTELEIDIQNKLGEGLSARPPNMPALAQLADAMAKKYDEVIALSVKGPPLHVLFDDVATVRIVRADLRIASSGAAGR
jgi:hypothetical protein